MKKLLSGLSKFRSSKRNQLKDTFEELALGQKPDVLYIGCSDSRVAVNVFASTDPGDLFVVRNVGNLVAPCGPDGKSHHHNSVWAAVEFALVALNAPHIVVCGHSGCGAIQAAVTGQVPEGCSHLSEWIDQIGSLEDCCMDQITPGLSNLNQISQANVIRQLKNLETSPLVQKRLKDGSLQLHGWWFDIGQVEVYTLDPQQNKFVVMDEAVLEKLISISN